MKQPSRSRLTHSKPSYSRQTKFHQVGLLVLTFTFILGRAVKNDQPYVVMPVVVVVIVVEDPHHSHPREGWGGQIFGPRATC